MKIKIVAAAALCSLFAMTCSFADDLQMADDNGLGSTNQAQTAPGDNPPLGAAPSTNQNSTDMTNPGSTDGNSTTSTSNTSDDMSADTATGDDDY